jgi:hypothetical protein
MNSFQPIILYIALSVTLAGCSAPVEEVVYHVGDVGPAGGYIFYDDEADGTDNIPGYRYLEVAASDTNSSIIWSDIGNTLIGTTGSAIGTGFDNSMAISGQSGCTTGAARACLDYSVIINGTVFGDWFLPSRDELDLIYVNLYNIAVPLGGFTNQYYWTSTENAANTAWEQYFATGAKNSNFAKDGNLDHSRAIRRF